MIFRFGIRCFLPFALAAAVGLPGAAQSQQSTQPAPVSSSSSSSSSSSNDVASLYGTPVEQIVARVNDRVITNSDVQRAQEQLDQDARQNNWSLEEYNRHQKNLLRDLIDMQLLLSKGKQLGITGDTDLIKRLDEIRKQNHLDSLDDLEKAVEQQGISYEDFKANIRNSIITQAVVRDQVGSKLQISEAEIEKYYNEHKDAFTQPESIHLNEILIPTSENPSPSELSAAEAKANDIEAKLQAGGKFADLAKKYSGGPTAQQGGDLGNFRRGALAKVLEDQTFSLPVGGYTKPIRTKQGYIILQVTEHNPGGVAPLQKVEPQIEQAIYEQKIQPAVRQYLTRLRNEAYIDIRPGYTDTAASPGESKPTFMAYTPPQPKKKKKKKSRFDRRYTVDKRFSRSRKSAATATAAAIPAAAASGAAATGSAANSVTSVDARGNAGRMTRASAKKTKPRKVKREKVRYGRAPRTPVSEEQVANASAATQQAPATPAPGVTDAAGGTDVQPLGPDLEHNPVVNPPKPEKRRFSDEARDKAELEARKNQQKRNKAEKKAEKKAAKAKKKSAVTPTPLSATELANQKVQSAPLGLDTTASAKKTKKKKTRVKGAEKVRLSDEKKAKKSGAPSQPTAQDSSAPAATGDGTTTTPAPPGPAAQPQ